MPTIAGQPITHGELRLFEQGDWFGEVSTNSGERIPDGARVDIVCETLTLSGAVVRGGITDEVGRYQVAGRPEWSQPIAPRAYQSAGAVLLKTVLGDIAREALGPSWANLVVMPPAATLARQYERAGASPAVSVLARDALTSLGVPWYVRNDGVTVFAKRAAGDVTTESRVLVEYRNDAIGYRVVNCEDPAAFAPGLTLEGEAIGEVVLSMSAEDIKLHVWTRAASSSFADAVRAVWRRLFPRVEMQGLFSYVTVGQAQESRRHDLRSTRSRHLPDVKLADARFAPGISAHLRPGTNVLLAFADGDPAQPVVVAAEPYASPGHAPFQSFHEATDRIDMVYGSAGNVHVAGEKAVAVAEPLIDYLKQAERHTAYTDQLLIAVSGALLLPPPFSAIDIAASAAERIKSAGYVYPAQSASFSSVASTRLYADQAENIPGPPGPGS